MAWSPPWVHVTETLTGRVAGVGNEWAGPTILSARHRLVALERPPTALEVDFSS
jgi:hypothetical protein